MLDKKNRVFISYAKEDLNKAERLYKDLKSAGVQPWIDFEDLLPGEKWKETTRRAILENNFFLALLSTNSLSEKGYVQKELKIAFTVKSPCGFQFSVVFKSVPGSSSSISVIRKRYAPISQ